MKRLKRMVSGISSIALAAAFRGKQLLAVCAVLGSIVAPISSAAACGGIFDAGCNLKHGGMSPKNIGKQTEHVVHDIGNTVFRRATLTP
ncbi:UNVERIFIED_CONTAM: hypothetical protein Q9R58_25135 [Methylobacteriaceae bacterium AG10]|nr:hypothetical protein [Methylobacteriaceae bacterium AG10]